MDLIISDPVTVSKVERIRAPQIYITNPFQEVGVHPSAEISFNSEKLLVLDGVVTAALPANPVVRKTIAVITETVTVTDPVTQQTITMSAAGMAEAIAAFYCRWYAADRAAEAAAKAAAEAAANPPPAEPAP